MGVTMVYVHALKLIDFYKTKEIEGDISQNS